MSAMVYAVIDTRISNYNTQNSKLNIALRTVAGSGFAPQAYAYSIIPAEPFEVINLNN